MRRGDSGRVSYLDAWLDDCLMADWMLRLLKQSGVNVSSSAVGVEVCRRVKAGREMRIVINQGTKPATVKLGRRILKIKRENVVVIT